MMALRALRAHGYRTLLATGRSLPEVRDRCAAYRLVGGVAEYGAVATDAGNGSVYDLVTDTDWEEQRKLLWEELAAFPDVRLDPKYRWCVRALGFRGAIGTLPHTVAIPGDAQTDFIPSGVDKATGIRALFALLGEHHAEVALAVGDTAMDLSMLRMARLGLAPGHASSALRDEGVRCTRAPYQAGLAQAVGRLIGHPPGACDQCAPPALTPPERFVASLVSVGERGRRGLAPAVLGLAAQRFRLREKGGRPWR
jgi:3-deoxy-D-manno-octulosonate 8-phosphate phosphatase KdsC-like HAD superfamily phosphatase